ncbi:hypothetical protein DPMN_179056 [Dreissena polymorpha]|uniref:Uncharacterized protein n=1 Tax=Dreissena polymorpha TaxID=45954 RepID=A0A9D4EDB5_DREPO|nr:hypothetical protein DPMN_179056 [Dreissena polymorpha]
MVIIIIIIKVSILLKFYFILKVNVVLIGDDFLVDDVRVVDATSNQLKEAWREVIDGTFKLVKTPVYQLFTIHAFVKKGDDTKQVPLVYVLMSRHTKDDYISVLTSTHQRLENPLVKWVMLNFEAGNSFKII